MWRWSMTVSPPRKTEVARKTWGYDGKMYLLLHHFVKWYQHPSQDDERQKATVRDIGWHMIKTACANAWHRCVSLRQTTRKVKIWGVIWPVTRHALVNVRLKCCFRFCGATCTGLRHRIPVVFYNDLTSSFDVVWWHRQQSMLCDSVRCCVCV